MDNFTSGIRLAPLVTSIKVDIKGFKTEMEQVKAQAVAEAKKISDELETTAKVGKNLSKLGGTLTTGLTLPLTAVGTAAVKTSMDFEQAMSSVKAITNATSNEFDLLKEKAIELGGSTVFSASEVADAMTEMAKAGWSTQQILEGMEGVLNATSASGEQLATVSTIVADAITGFGLSASDSNRVANLLTQSANAGTIGIYDLGESFKYIAPIAKTMNFNIEDVTTAVTAMSTAGIKGSQAGTSLRTMFTRLVKPTEDVYEVMQLLGIEMTDGQGNFKSLDSILTDMRATFSGLTDEQQTYYASILAGQEGMSGLTTLLSMTQEEYDNIANSMKNAEGVATSTAETMQDNLAGAVEELTGSLESAGIVLGERAIPYIRDFAVNVTELVGEINDLSDEQLDNIIKWGLMTAAIGPAFKITGSLITNYTKLKPLISGTNRLFKDGVPLVTKYFGANTALGTALSTVTTAVAPYALAIGGAVVATKAIDTVMSEEVIPTVDLFTDKVEYTTSAYGTMASVTDASVVQISDATEQAVQAYMNMDNQLTQALYNQQISHSVITAEIANTTITSFQNMANSIMETETNSYNQQLASYSEFFASSSALTTEREAQIVQTINDKHFERQNTVQTYMDQITAIYQNAADEHRELTQQEQLDIKEIQEQMRDDAINAMSETEQEANVIRERMNDYQGRLSAEMASDMITKAIETKDGEVQAAEEKYDEIIRLASRMKEAGDITQEEYQAMVDEAEATKNAQVKRAEEACEGIKNEIANATPGIENEVSFQTGAIMNGWDRLAYNASQTWNYISSLWNKSSSAASSMVGVASSFDGSHYNGLSYVPFDGYNARLHKGERVLTEKENKAYTQGLMPNNSGFSFDVHDCEFNVRDDSDIEKIAKQLYDLYLKDQRGMGFV